MQHDIYSLGACLLEIGLWESFIRYDETGKQAASGTVPTNGIGTNGVAHPLNTHASLLTLAKNKLPKHMGGNVNFSDEREFADEDGIIVGVKYVEKIIMQLNTISM
ncbi:hypothetical protein NUW58_g5063 [Xylaria curta]|uniref:Uncharacterized protein n=1 Tax=Xylaria curta TaxID=42375 RepID=A0ACC1P3H1_9PEZI|nr:hypothetical protein NUW58_g5063 [Xylaria curta]